jgi:hypothetical protein
MASIADKSFPPLHSIRELGCRRVDGCWEPRFIWHTICFQPHVESLPCQAISRLRTICVCWRVLRRTGDLLTGPFITRPAAVFDANRAPIAIIITRIGPPEGVVLAASPSGPVGNTTQQFKQYLLRAEDPRLPDRAAGWRPHWIAPSRSLLMSLCRTPANPHLRDPSGLCTAHADRPCRPQAWRF